MTALDDLAGRLTCTVPEAGRLLGIGRDVAYRAAERGEIPTLRLGRRIVVPVSRLLELVGVDSRLHTATADAGGSSADKTKAEPASPAAVTAAERRQALPHLPHGR